MSACLACLDPVVASVLGDAYHPGCAKRLFGSARVPSPDNLTVAKVRAATPAQKSPGARLGERPGLTVDISADKRRLEAVPAAGRYILRPQATQFPQLPENELLTMRLAELVGIEIPACALVRLRDRTLAFLVRRSDAPQDGDQPVFETFRQLAATLVEPTPDDSGELCAEIARRYASEPLVALLKVYRVIVFAWWTGNGGLDLESLAFATGADGLRRIAPARNLLCTRLVIPDDALALPVGGKRDRFARADWLRFGDACGLRPRIVERVLGSIASSFDEALGLVARSFLRENAKVAYAELLGRRTAMLES
jgi:serine/threonine-protein kinase HipA